MPERIRHTRQLLEDRIIREGFGYGIRSGRQPRDAGGLTRAIVTLATLLFPASIPTASYNAANQLTALRLELPGLRQQWQSDRGGLFHLRLECAQPADLYLRWRC
jgi:hypothetical protein